MQTETGFKECLEAMRKHLEGCREKGELMKMQDDLRDFLIEIMPGLINTATGIRKRAKLKRTFMEIVSERHGVNPKL